MPTGADGSVLAMFGPTASGKSAVAQAISERIPAEIVSADAMQVYRGLPLLTNQPTSPVRLVGIWELDHEASVGEYALLAHEAIDGALAAGRTPIVVGGTGLYLRAALADLELPPPPPPGLRDRLEGLYDRLGPDEAHALLTERDEAAARAVHANDRRRIVRALELSQRGETLAPTRNRLWTGETRHPTLVFGLEVPKDVLTARIDARTRAMFEQGVEQEVERALAQPLSSTARKVIGLREVAELSRDEAVAEMGLRTVQYAAYQRKWMRRIRGLVLLDADRPPTEVADELLSLVAEQFTLSGQQEDRARGIRKGEADQTGRVV